MFGITKQTSRRTNSAIVVIVLTVIETTLGK